MKRNSFLLFVLLLIALGALFFRFAPPRATRSATELARNVGDSASQVVEAIASVVASPNAGEPNQPAEVGEVAGKTPPVEFPVLTKRTEEEVVIEQQKNEMVQAAALKEEEAKVLHQVNGASAVVESENVAGDAAQRASDLLTQAIKAADEAKAQMLIAQRELRGEVKASLNLKRAPRDAVAPVQEQGKTRPARQEAAPRGEFGELEAELARNTVHFNWMKSTLDDESQVRLAKIARAIEKNPNADVQITGYTDNNGKPELNKWLGLIRARRVREQLIAQGISPKRLSVSSEGANNPVATNDTPLGRWKNRRVEFSVTTK